MNTLMTINWRTQGLATVAAALATLLTAGGPLMLAEHYAQTGASAHASGYHATEQIRRVARSDHEDSCAPSVSTLRSADKS